MKNYLCALLGLTLTVAVLPAVSAGFQNRSGVDQLVDNLVAKGVSEATTRKLLGAARSQSDVLDTMRDPAESRLNWGQYRAIFLQDKRARQGAEFLRRHKSVFQRVARQYGVPAHVIAAIIGVETRYGRHMGNDRVLDSLATLAFDYPPRQSFFRRELASFIRLCTVNNLDCRDLEGSYAGALGVPQFMPSSYRAYAVDGNDDGERDLWHQPADVIASVANYLSKNGWQNDTGIAASAEVAESASVADSTDSRPEEANIAWHVLANDGVDVAEPPPADARVALMRLEGENAQQYWIAEHNYFVIMTYNHSVLYAMAVYQLSQSIASHLD